MNIFGHLSGRTRLGHGNDIRLPEVISSFFHGCFYTSFSVFNGHSVIERRVRMYNLEVFDELMREVRELNTSKGWRTGETTPGEYVALLHSEASEVLEAYRTWKLADPTAPNGKPEGVGSELADCLIRVLDMADVFDVDLAFEYERKMKYNWTREFRHGGRTL